MYVLWRWKWRGEQEKKYCGEQWDGVNRFCKKRWNYRFSISTWTSNNNVVGASGGRKNRKNRKRERNEKRKKKNCFSCSLLMYYVYFTGATSRKQRPTNWTSSTIYVFAMKAHKFKFFIPFVIVGAVCIEAYLQTRIVVNQRRSFVVVQCYSAKNNNTKQNEIDFVKAILEKSSRQNKWDVRLKVFCLSVPWHTHLKVLHIKLHFLFCCCSIQNQAMVRPWNSHEKSIHKIIHDLRT